MNKQNHSFLKGFTLIELLVAVTIVGVIAAIGTVAYSNTQKKARDGRRKSDLQNLRFAVEQYRAINLSYPDTGTQYNSCSGTWPPPAIAGDFPGPIQDPKNTGYYCYYYAADSSGYEINAVLETDDEGLNANDHGDEDDVYEIGNYPNLELIQLELGASPSPSPSVVESPSPSPSVVESPSPSVSASPACLPDISKCSFGDDCCSGLCISGFCMPKYSPLPSGSGFSKD